MATEYLQFAGAMVLMLGILIGSYWFVYVPNHGTRAAKIGRGRSSRDGTIGGVRALAGFGQD